MAQTRLSGSERAGIKSQQIHDFSRFNFWGDCDIAQTFDGQSMPAAFSGRVTGLGMNLSQTLIEAQIASATYSQAPVNC